MKIAGISLLLGTALLAFAQKGDPAATLFDIGVRDEQSGRLDRAKLTLLTLASTYYDSPLAEKAKLEIGAIYIFGEAQAQMRSGRSHDAYYAFNTVTRVYPGERALRSWHRPK
jgi:outer membrane protein assembly factor BamD (BamD/ComL family)